jgi:hypothetical protein
MSDLQPKGEKLRRAVRWLSDRRRAEPDAPLASLLDQATQRFDLSPREAELLIDFARPRGKAEPEHG